ncbi:unnamed protein product [Paramecium octaurelia]|uniref:Uncharacterized protein n=1 Tax=Paramecium octaurelia TaxID=43137 RepID=A0A8S1X9Z3_PAROT|nr:unnamed protein product [Paramecium octaurelia]
MQNFIIIHLYNNSQIEYVQLLPFQYTKYCPLFVIFPQIKQSDIVRGLPSSVDWLYEGSEIQIFFNGQLQPLIVVVRLEIDQKGKLFWFRIEDNSWRTTWHWILIRWYACLTEELWDGLLRISLDDIMTCPLCEANFNSQDIFKHSCASNLALDLPKGWPK